MKWLFEVRNDKQLLGVSAKEGKHTLKRKPQTRTERVWVNAVFNSLHEILFFKAKRDASLSTALTHSGVCPSTGQEKRLDDKV